MSFFMLINTNSSLTRREWLKKAGTGLGMIGMAGLLADEKKANPFKANPVMYARKPNT